MLCFNMNYVFFSDLFLKVYTRAMLFFTEVSGYLKKIETRFSGMTLNINGSIKEFIDIEKILAVEKFEFEVSLFFIYPLIYVKSRKRRELNLVLKLNKEAAFFSV